MTPEVELALRLGVALAIIAAAGFAGGRLALRAGQPAVLGEVVAGFALGPSLLGALVPGSGVVLAGAAVAPVLGVLAQAGVVLLMLGVGWELAALRATHRRDTLNLSAVSLLVPFALGVPVALLLAPRFAAQGIPPLAFVALLSSTIAVTALPVLARIVQEARLGGHPVARQALACSALVYGGAWAGIVVMAVAAVAGGLGTALGRLAIGCAFVAFALAVGVPLLRRLVRRLPGAWAPAVVGYALALATSLAAARAGLPPLFGGLVVGLALGAEPFERLPIAGHVERLSRYLLLPVFFTQVGLNVDVSGAVGQPQLVAGALLVLVATLAGKFATGALMGRSQGLVWRDATGLGVLLSTKGVTSLVMLKTGLDAGVLRPDAFAILCLLSLSMTAAALPALRRLGLAPSRQRGRPHVPAPALGMRLR